MPAQASPGRAIVAAAAVLLTAPALLLTIFVVALLGAPGAGKAAGGDLRYGASAFALKDIPPDYLRLYQDAADRYGLDWAILAAVGSIETDHGRSPQPGVRSGLNSYGCCGGPMQFWIAPPHPNTWDQFGLDGNGDGRADPYDPADAIPAAARYLRASGAPAAWRRALFAYNHAGWYVDDVLARADRYRGEITALSDPALAGGSRVARLIAIADQVDRAHIPYCYGGGHDTTPARPGRGSYCWHTGPDRKVQGSPDLGLDCSSSVSLLLQTIGYPLPTLTSGGLAEWGQPGPGTHVTIWSNEAHVFLVIDGRYWGTSQENYRHGPGWHAARSTAGFIARHPAGM